MQFRELRFEGKTDPKTRTVPITVSSDTPVDRGSYVEILDHTRGGVDLSRAPLPLIESHDSGRLNIGIVEDLHLAGGRLRGTARFGTSRRAAEVFADVEAGIVRGVSIGYELLDDGRPVPHPSGRGRLFKFRLLEVSAVAVPADPSVGFYRSKRTSTMDNQNFNAGGAGESGEGQGMSRAQRRAAAYSGADDGAALERERVKAIMALATAHSLRELGERAIHDGMPLEQFRSLALDALHQRGSDRPLYQPASDIGLTGRETRQFSVAKLYRSLVENKRDIAAFERTCTDEIQTRMERLGQGPKQGGVFLPLQVMEAPLPGAQVRDGRLMVGDRVVQRDLFAQSPGSGASLVATNLLAASFSDLLRARTLVLGLGAMKLSGLVGNIAIPRQTGTVTIQWREEGEPADESDATFGTLNMRPRTAHGIQDVTREMLMQSTPAIEGIVRADLLACMAVTIDYAAINGTGTNGQPLGILNSSPLYAVPTATNGSAPTWDLLVQLEEAVANGSNDQGQMAYLINPKVRSRLKRTQRFAGTDGTTLFERPFDGDDPAAFGVINGYRAGVTTQMRSDLTQGTAVGVCSSVLYGDFSNVIIGEWSTPEILPDPYTQAANRIIRMHVYQSVDVGLRRSLAFALMNGVLTA